MTIDQIITAMEAERDCLDQAINALRGGRPRNRGAAKGRHMKESTKRLISQMMKKRWAERKRLAKSGK